MPYYVYAIHTDHTNNRLYGKFSDFKEADEIEKDMAAGNYPGDNYFVRMFYADDDNDASIKADELRPHPQRTNLTISI